MDEIICRNCNHWGYNNGKEMNSVGCSKCLLLVRMTHGCNFCKNFKPLEEKVVQKVDKPRPIDANKLVNDVKNIQYMVSGMRAGKTVLSEFSQMYRKDILKVIDEQPTICDVNEVIEKLEYAMNNCDLKLNGKPANMREQAAYELGLSYAIEILKGNIK